MKIFPQFGIPDQDGDLVMTYNGVSVTIKDAHIDSVAYEVGGGGQIVNVRFMDSRWKWAHRYVTGRYNFRLPNNWINPAHEKTPQQLATLCFQAMGESVFDVSALPNDARPEADWDHSNAAQELDRICNDLGCKVVPVRSIGGWKIVVTGVGADLPNAPAEDVGQGIDPQEVPDYIKIVTGPIRYQMQLPLAPIGKDTDLSWKPLKQLSYAPLPIAPSGGFGNESANDMRNISSTRAVLADGTKVSPQELAQDTVFKNWRIDFTNTGIQGPDGDYYITVPTLQYKVNRKMIILSNELAQMWTDYLGALHQRPAFITGVFWSKFGEGAASNTAVGTRIDKQYKDSATSMDERASFSLSLDPEDTDRSIISISPKMVQQINPPITGVGLVPIAWAEATLKFTTAFQVRDPVTWQPNRYEFLMQIGSGTDTNFAYTVIRDDIQPVVIQNYRSDGTASNVITNQGEVNTQCAYYANALARKFITVTSEHATYIGIFPLDMDGAICQITYSVSVNGGTSMIASQGTEHSYYTPEYEERRQQVARQGISEKLIYVKYETARRKAYLGNVNT